MKTHYTNFQTTEALLQKGMEAGNPEDVENWEKTQARAKHPDETITEILYREMSKEVADEVFLFLSDADSPPATVMNFNMPLYDEAGEQSLRSGLVAVWGVGKNQHNQTVYFTGMGDVVVTR